MPTHTLRRRVIAGALVATAAACSFPADASDGVYVSVSAASPVLLRGGETELVARVWQREGTDSVELRNAEVLWYSGDTRLATVASDGRGIGRVTGVNPGHVELRAVAAGFERAAPGVYALRVANPLEIDSLTPDTVHYGEKLTMYGIGVGELFFAGLGSGFLAADSFSIAGDPRGQGSIGFWVPYPVQSGQVFAAGSGQLISAPRPTVVLPWDIYEPNEAAPARIDLDAPGPFAPLPAVRFFNPALMFEDLRRASFGVDRYRFHTTKVGTPHTFLLVAPTLANAQISFLSSGDSTGWSIGGGQYRCKGAAFTAPQAPSDSLIVALARMPADTIDLASIYVQQGLYFLAVIEGYATTDPRIGPDRFEENDDCDFADSNFAQPQLAIDLTTPFAENLTIDNPHDVDWIRFRVPSGLPQAVTIRSAAQPFAAGDRSDIDLWVLDVPSSGTLGIRAQDDGPGSTASITTVLDPGDYYLVVTDSAGMPTRYGLCIAAGTSCTLPTPPAAAVVAEPAAAAMRVISPQRLYAKPRADVPTRRAGARSPR